MSLISRLVSSSVLLLGALAVSPPAGADTRKVTIAVELPFFQWFDLTRNMASATRMAVDDRGGQVCGDWKVEVALNDQSDPRSFVSEKKVIDDARRDNIDKHIGAVLGTYTSGSASLLVPIVNATSLLVVSPSNTAPCLTVSGPDCELQDLYPNGVRNYGRVTPHDLIQGARQATWAAEILGGAGTVFLAHLDEGYGNTIAATFRAAAPAGLAIVGEEAYPFFGDLTYEEFLVAMDPIAQAVMAVQPPPDMVVSAGFDETAALIERLRARGFTGAVMFGDGAFGDGIIERLGAGAEGLYATLPGIGPGSFDETAKEWAARLATVYGAEPTPYTPEAYMAANLILDAFQDACDAGHLPSDRDAVRAAGLAVGRSHASPFGAFSLDANGDIVGGGVAAYRVEDHDGVLEWVFQKTLR